MTRLRFALTTALLLASAALAAEPSQADVARNYAAIAHAAYADTLAAARRLQGAVRAFVARPEDERLAAARRAWLAAREWYGQTEAFRFYGGPIDDRDGPEPRLNAWPVDESYIDSVREAPGAGIVNDRRVALAKPRLAALNERGGEQNVSTGWHAIEFLLWGQDFDPHGPGARPYTDFVDGKARNADRRRQYLALATDLLVDDLAYLERAWRAGARNYRAQFEAAGTEAIRRIIVGLGSLARGEMAGERMEVALATQDQEDEQSCFSDNTHRDLIADALGIENVWLGRYLRADGSRLEGASLRDLVAARDGAAAQRTSADLEHAVAAIGAIRSPFDQEILGGPEAPGRQRVQAAADALKRLSADLVADAGALGITRLTLAPPKRR